MSEVGRALRERVAHSLAIKDLQLLEQLEAGVAVMDAAGIVVRWNVHAERILGIPEGEALGKPWSGLIAVVRGDSVAGREVRVAAMEPGGWHGLTKLRVASARDVWVRAHVQSMKLAAIDEQPGVVAIFWAEPGPTDEMDDNGPTLLPYRDLFRRSPEALLLTDLDGTIIDANDAAADLHGRNRSDMIGRSYLGDIQDWTPSDTQEAQTETVSAGSIVREYTLKRATGDTVRVEAIGTLVSPVERGYVIVRLRDLTRVHAREQMLRDLGRLARLSDEPLAVDDVARKVLEIVGGAWRASASLIVLHDADESSVVAGPDTPDAVRSVFLAMEPATSPIARSIIESDKPFASDLKDAGTPEVVAGWLALGLSTLRATPLWFADRKIGTIVLLWSVTPDLPFDATRLEQLGRHGGLAVGNAQLRDAMHRDAALRARIEERARTGGVVLSQMAEAIVTMDADLRITSVNPAAEHLYGVRADELVGRQLHEGVESFALDGSPLGSRLIDETRAVGYWHGRVIHKPLLGALADGHIVADLSLTAIHGDGPEPTGFISLSKAAPADASIESQVAAMGSLAVAIGRAGNRHETADAGLERLCELASADLGVIVTWADGHQVIEASRGFSEDLLRTVRTASIPGIGAALDQPGQIVAVEAIGHLIDGTEIAALLARDGVATGFLVDLRAGDRSIGFLCLASQRPGWARPADETILQAASQIASAIENRRLMERLEQGLNQEKRLTAQLDTLMSLTLLPPGNLSEEAVSGILLERVVAALEAEIGFVVRIADGRFRVVAARNLPEPMRQLAESRPPDDFHFWRRLTSTEQGGAFQELLTNAAGVEPGVAQMMASGITAHAVFPVRDGDRLVGAFLCYFKGTSGITTQADDRNVEAVGRIISIAYDNARMSESLAEAAEHERRLTAELRALQELTLLGAATDDLTNLAQETIDEVALATGATGGGYILVDPASEKVDPIAWVGERSAAWPPARRAAAGPGRLAAILDDSQINAAASGSRPPSPAKATDLGRRPGRAAASRRRPAGRRHPPRVVRDRPAASSSTSTSSSRSPASAASRSPTSGSAPSCSHRAADQRALNHRLGHARRTDPHRRAGQLIRGARPPDRQPGPRGPRRGRRLLPADRARATTSRRTPSPARPGAFRLWLKGVPARDAPGGSLLLSGGSSVLGDFVAGAGQRPRPAAGPRHRLPVLRRDPDPDRRGAGRRAAVLLRAARRHAARSTSRPSTPSPGSPASPLPTTASASGSSRPRSGTAPCSRSRPTPCSSPPSTAPCSTPTRPPSACTASTAARSWGATSASSSPPTSGRWRAAARSSGPRAAAPSRTGAAGRTDPSSRWRSRSVSSSWAASAASCISCATSRTRSACQRELLQAQKMEAIGQLWSPASPTS